MHTQVKMTQNASLIGLGSNFQESTFAIRKVSLKFLRKHQNHGLTASFSSTCSRFTCRVKSLGLPPISKWSSRRVLITITSGTTLREAMGLFTVLDPEIIRRISYSKGSVCSSVSAKDSSNSRHRCEQNYPQGFLLKSNLWLSYTSSQFLKLAWCAFSRPKLAMTQNLETVNFDGNWYWNLYN